MTKTTEKTKRLKVGAVQMISTHWDLAGNLHKALRFCDRAARRHVQILCFPECASVGFDWVQEKPPADQVPAEPVPGPLVQRFAEKARETDMYIIFGMAERPRRSKRLYNSAFLVGPEEGYSRLLPEGSFRASIHQRPRSRSVRDPIRCHGNLYLRRYEITGHLAIVGGKRSEGSLSAHQLLPHRRYGSQKQICGKTYGATKPCDGQRRPPGGGKRRPRGVRQR